MSKYKPCPCKEVGADGTEQHDAPSEFVATFHGKRLIGEPLVPCNNHLPNYRRSKLFIVAARDTAEGAMR